MKSIYLILIIQLAFVQILNAQQRGNGERPPTKIVKGKVIDSETNSPLEYATVTLFRMRDSSVVTGGITDINGLFNINTRPGRFFIKIEFISYKTKYIDQLRLPREKAMADLGTIKLELDAETLTEVEVRAERSDVQLMLDKKVFNVGKDLANKGGTAIEILDNVPSVTVDIDGNVSLRGSQNVRILVNGKPSGLVGLSSADALRQFPSYLVERVEVITNPSARYEAEGMAGIINIVLKKDKKKGLNGSFDVSAGLPSLYGVGISMNYRREKMNLFANYGLGYRNNPGGGSLYREQMNDGEILYLDQEREHERGGLSNSYRFGADFFMNPKNTLTAAFLLRLAKEDNFSEIIYRDYLNEFPQNLTGVTRRTDVEEENETNLEYSLTHVKTFDKKEHNLTFDARYEERSEKESSDYVEKYFSDETTPSGTANLNQRSANEEASKRWLFQVDYIRPFNKKGKFELGHRTSLRRITNDYVIEEYNNGNWTDLGFSNDFRYDENIYAFYAIFGDKRNKFSYQLGLRGELSDVKTSLIETNEVNPRNYFDLFPSVHLTYDLPQSNAIQLSYSRRIRRPRFWFLNPFFTFSDSRNFFGGNPNLDPVYTNSYEIGHIKYWEKASLNSAIFYRHSTGVIQRITTVFPDGSSIRMPQNLSNQDDFGLEFNFSLKPVKWFSLNGDANFFRSIIDGEFEGVSFDRDTYTWNGRISSKLTAWKELDIQIRFNYRAPRETTQGSREAMYFMDLGMSKDILKKKGTLTLSANDVFNTRRRIYTVVGDNFYSEGDWQWRSRQIKLNFNYRLNQKKKRSRDRGNYGGGDEGGF